MSPNPDQHSESDAVKRKHRNYITDYVKIVGGALVVLFAGIWKRKRGEKSDHDQQRADEHLIASATDKMARYAKWLAGITLLSVVTAGFTAYILYDQLMEMTAEERAYVNVPQIEFTRNADDGNKIPEPYWAFTPEITNDGNTPTKFLEWASGAVNFDVTPCQLIGYFPGRKLKHQYRCTTEMRSSPGVVANVRKIFPQVKEIWAFPPDPENLFAQKNAVRRFVLGAHEKFILGQVQFIEQQIVGGLKERGLPAYLYGEIRYKDTITEKQHITKYCYQIGGDAKTTPFTPYIAPCVYWNCADDECTDDKRRYDEELAKWRKENPAGAVGG